MVIMRYKQYYLNKNILHYKLKYKVSYNTFDVTHNVNIMLSGCQRI